MDAIVAAAERVGAWILSDDIKRFVLEANRTYFDDRFTFHIQGNKMTEAFFYGLFMDQDLLREKGLHPSNPRRGYVAGMGLRIGQRATLLHVPDEKAYGIVMTLSDEEISELYAEESVSDYRPEQVTVMLDNGASIEATCYNLPEHLLSGSNQAYAASLAQIAEKCGLPQDYVALVKRFPPYGENEARFT